MSRHYAKIVDFSDRIYLTKVVGQLIICMHEHQQQCHHSTLNTGLSAAPDTFLSEKGMVAVDAHRANVLIVCMYVSPGDFLLEL